MHPNVKFILPVNCQIFLGRSYHSCTTIFTDEISLFWFITQNEYFLLLCLIKTAGFTK